MTRVLLLILAIAEIALGAYGAIGAINLLLAHNAGMVLIFLPLLAIMALLLIAGAAIFVRRRWSYYVHIGVILLIGLLFVFFVGPLVGSDAWIVALAALAVVAPLTAIFLLPSVRRYFGVTPAPPPLE